MAAQVARYAPSWTLPKHFLLYWIKIIPLQNQISAEAKGCCFSPASSFCLISYLTTSRSWPRHESHHCWVRQPSLTELHDDIKKQHQKIGVYVSMHAECRHQYCNELPLIRNFSCIALTWTENTPIFTENICIFRQHHCCSAEHWRRDFTWVDVLFKMQRLLLREEAHFQTGKWAHNILWKPLEVSLVSPQKLPCLHSSHSALVTICERHFKADFSKPGSACAFQTLLPTPQLSRICCYFKKLYVPRKSSVG